MSTARNQFAISNIAWPAEVDDQALDLAVSLGFTGIEVAPAKVFGSLDTATQDRAVNYRQKLASFGLEIPAMQAILFGVTDTHLFRDSESRRRLAFRLQQVSDIAQALGARSCVFGSPTLRDPGNLNQDCALKLAVDFFTEVADIYAQRDVQLCFEANPPQYNCRFATRTIEAMHLVAAVGKAGFSLQFDAGAIFMNGEDVEVATSAARIAGHVHISEPNLAPVGSTGVDHGMIAASLDEAGYAGWRSIEMKSVNDWRKAMRDAARIIESSYL
jgi:sugar phosphate isomerase/epimerase